MPERPYSILHVEDNARLREQMALILKSYQIEGSPNVSEGLFAAQRQAYQLYLLDINLPDGSGFDLCERIRRFDRCTPIVMTSLQDSESFRDYARSLGAQAFWGKHQDVTRLNSMISDLLYESRVRSLQAKQAEFAAIRLELERQRENARAERQKAQEIQASCHEKRAMWTAYRAFSDAGGGRADFYQWWREMYAEALNKPV